MNKIEDMDVKKMMGKVQDVGATVMEETYNTGVVGINAAMALTTALAWHQTANALIKKYVPVVRLTEFNIVYACMVTVFSSLVFMLTQKFLKPSIKRTEITPVISYKA